MLLNACRSDVLVLLVTILVLQSNSTSGSEGDRLPFFRNCLMKCFDRTLEPAAATVDNSYDCNYKCVWRTVQFRQQRNLHIPQFYGRMELVSSVRTIWLLVAFYDKPYPISDTAMTIFFQAVVIRLSDKWPLIRIFGLEEPASVLFSLLNAFVNCWFYGKLYGSVIDKKSNVFFWNSTVFFVVSLHTWFWSTAFHARNTYVTELMDYTCAFSVMLVSNFLMIYRIFNKRLHGSLLKVLISVQVSVFVHYVLAMSRKIDYGFNMRLNIALGAGTSIGWLLWAFLRPQPPTRHLVRFVCLTSLALVFELIDFVPISWIFDAHSIWHLCTAITTPLFYRFLIEDCQQQQQLRNQTIAMKTKKKLS